jgi:hypothetical protein
MCPLIGEQEELTSSLEDWTREYEEEEEEVLLIYIMCGCVGGWVWVGGWVGGFVCVGGCVCVYIYIIIYMIKWICKGRGPPRGGPLQTYIESARAVARTRGAAHLRLYMCPCNTACVLILLHVCEHEGLRLRLLYIVVWDI